MSFFKPAVDRALAAGVTLAMSGWTLPAIAQDSGAEVYEFQCEGPLDIEFRTDDSVCNDELTITRGDGRIEISAGRSSTGEPPNFDSLEWQLTGGVRIRFDSALLVADSASVLFEADVLVSAEIAGSPVEFSDLIEGNDGEAPTEVRGTAERIVYDGATETLRMPGQGNIRFGRRNEQNFAGCEIVYDLRRQSLRIGTEDPNCGSQLRLSPSQAGDGDGDEQSASP